MHWKIVKYWRNICAFFLGILFRLILSDARLSTWPLVHKKRRANRIVVLKMLSLRCDVQNYKGEYKEINRRIGNLRRKGLREGNWQIIHKTPLETKNPRVFKCIKWKIYLDMSLKWTYIVACTAIRKVGLLWQPLVVKMMNCLKNLFSSAFNNECKRLAFENEMKKGMNWNNYSI